MRKLAVLFLALILAGCGNTDTARYHIKSDAMAPTITADTTVTAKRVKSGSYRGRRGEVVIFSKPKSWPGEGDVQVKRVIAIGGETVSCCDAAGRVTVDGSALDEPYLGQNAPLDGPAAGCGGRKFNVVTVPTDHLFVLGDTRLLSVDSACYGPIPSASVIGVVTPTPSG